MKKKVAIISFSNIARDARLLRQVKYLSPNYRLTVLGLGSEPEGFADKGITWVGLDPVYATFSSKRERLANIGRMIRERDREGLGLRVFSRAVYAAPVCPPLYEAWYESLPQVKNARKALFAEPFDAILANDWNTLPVSAQAAAHHGAKLVFDAHEYAPLEYEGLSWRVTGAPRIVHFLKKYAGKADAMITVGPIIAQKYRDVFGLNPTVIRNAPDAVIIERHDVNPDKINIIHHGGAVRVRRLEDMIEVVALTKPRFHLNFMLTGQDAAYIEELKALAGRIAPGRVTFHDPVPPSEVVHAIARFDMSLVLKKPLCFNEKFCLPNKFFDSIVAGLAVVSGPSPEMASIIREYGAGRVADSFSLIDVARALDSLSTDDIRSMRIAASGAAGVLNADHEMRKLTDIFRKVLG